MLSEKVIRFRHPDYDPDRAQKFISLSMSRHMSTRNISYKSIHAFLSNLVNKQTDRQTNTGKTCTSSFVGGNKRVQFLPHSAIQKLWCAFLVAFYSNYGVSLVVCEIFSVREWCDLENRISLFKIIRNGTI